MSCLNNPPCSSIRSFRFRIKAVLRPENEKSQPSRFSNGRGKSKRCSSPVFAASSIEGPPGCSKPKRRAVLSKASPGASSIVLYASVANVGIGDTYPTVTFTHRRTSTASKTSGNVRDTRVIKNGEIPPNDSLIIVDGRLVLERSSLKRDSVSHFRSSNWHC